MNSTDSLMEKLMKSTFACDIQYNIDRCVILPLLLLALRYPSQ